MKGWEYVLCIVAVGASRAACSYLQLAFSKRHKRTLMGVKSGPEANCYGIEEADAKLVSMILTAVPEWINKQATMSESINSLDQVLFCLFTKTNPGWGG